jgi:hypothetical protein
MFLGTLIIFSKGQLFKLFFTAIARLAFIKNRTKKKSYTIGNSYNSIQNAAGGSGNFDFVACCKKNPIEIEFFYGK